MGIKFEKYIYVTAKPTRREDMKTGYSNRQANYDLIDISISYNSFNYL